MLVRLLRILLAFALACLAAGLTMILFVFTPVEIIGLPPDVRADRVGKALELAGFVAVQVALFSSPFALLCIALGEMTGLRTSSYYSAVAVVIAAVGYFAQRSTEQIGQPTIANNYALTAFLVSGLVAGLVYWLAAGRYAGRRVTITAPLEASRPSGPTA